MKNEKYVEEFVIEAIEDGLVPSYTLQPIYESAFRSKFQQDFPDFYIELIRTEWVAEKVGFKISGQATYEDVAKEFEKFLDNYEGGADNALLKSAFSYSVKELTYKGNGEFYQYFSYSSNKLDSLFYILRYAINDAIDKDRGEVLDIMDAHGINSATTAFQETFPEFQNIQITALKNGKIKIKGLSSEEEAKIDHLFSLIK